jgi:hypothetical protein
MSRYRRERGLDRRRLQLLRLVPDVRLPARQHELRDAPGGSLGVRRHRRGMIRGWGSQAHQRSPQRLLEVLQTKTSVRRVAAERRWGCNVAADHHQRQLPILDALLSIGK